MKCPKCGEEVVVRASLFRRVAESISKFFARFKRKKNKEQIKPLAKKVEKKVVSKKKTAVKKSKKESVKVCLSVNKLKKYKKDNKLSALKLSKKLGVSDNAIYNWFSGRTSPTKKHKVEIRKLLNGQYLPKKEVQSKTKVTTRKRHNPWSNLSPEEAKIRKEKIAFGIKKSAIEKKLFKNSDELKSMSVSDPYYQKVKENTERRERELKELLERLAKENPSFHMGKKKDK